MMCVAAVAVAWLRIWATVSCASCSSPATIGSIDCEGCCARYTRILVFQVRICWTNLCRPSSQLALREKIFRIVTLKANGRSTASIESLQDVGDGLLLRLLLVEVEEEFVRLGDSHLVVVL